MKVATAPPQRIRLTEDWLNLTTGVAFREGTVLVRFPTGQYAPPDALPGHDCVGWFRDIAEIAEILEP